MCGHVGLFGGGITSDHVDMFKDLLFIDALRGVHGTGAAFVSTDGTCKFIKAAVPSWEFLAAKEVESYLGKASKYTALIGHNRHATQGAVDNHSNAHPFHHNHITMAHNGTMRSRYGLLGSRSDFEVDSNQIAYTLSQSEPQDFLKDVNGAYALVWHNATNNTINFVRNSERELYIAKVEGADVYFYASEDGMLLAAASRARRTVKFSSVEKLPVHNVWSYKLPPDYSTLVTKDDTVHYTPEDISYGNFGMTVYSGSKSYTPTPTLEDMGFKKGASVELIPCSHVPYNKDKTKVHADSLGTAIMMLDEYPYSYVVVESVSVKDFTELASVSAGSTTHKIVGELLSTGTYVRWPDGNLVASSKNDPHLTAKSLKVVDALSIVNEIEVDAEEDVTSVKYTLLSADRLESRVVLDSSRFISAASLGCTWCACDVPKNVLDLTSKNWHYDSMQNSLTCGYCWDLSILQ